MSTFILLLLVIVGGLMVVVSWQSDDFRVTRSTTIAAPAEAIFRQINDLHNWEGWSPWAKLDPNAVGAYDGSPAGVGSSFAWSSENNQVGKGRMTIVESRPDELVRMRLEFEKPMKAVNTAEFVLKPSGDQTSVTWSMFGKNNFVCKAMSIVMNCDKMVGGQFEKGLAAIKEIAETRSLPGAAEPPAA